MKCFTSYSRVNAEANKLTQETAGSLRHARAAVRRKHQWYMTCHNMFNSLRESKKGALALSIC